MKLIDVFYQGETLGEIKHFEIELNATFASVRKFLADEHGLPRDVLVFLEDEDEPVDDRVRIEEHATPKGLKLHVHRLRHVKVTVTFNAKTVERLFSPSATVARVKHWAAVGEFGMSVADAGEHVLQLAGTHEQPTEGTHIGALSGNKSRALTFDLVPKKRVNGTSRDRA